MVRRVMPGTIGNSKGVVRTLLRVPNSLLAAQDEFLGESDRFINIMARLRSIGGLVILTGIAVVYPGYTKSMPELVTTSGNNVPAGIVTALKFAGNWLTSVLYGLAILLPCIVVFAVVMMVLTRSGARLVMLRRLCLPLMTFALFVVMMSVIIGIVDLFNLVFTWGNRQASSIHVGDSLGSYMKALILIVIFVVVGVILVVVFVAVTSILAVWYVKAIYLAAVDVFRASDAHPLLAPVATTAVSWVLASLVMTTGGPTGVSRSLGFLLVFTGPTAVTVINFLACIRLWRKYHDLLFREGPVLAARSEAAAGAF